MGRKGSGYRQENRRAGARLRKGLLKQTSTPKREQTVTSSEGTMVSSSMARGRPPCPAAHHRGDGKTIILNVDKGEVPNGHVWMN